MVYKWLKEDFPEAVICIDMKGSKWIDIGGCKYTNVESFSISQGIYRIWLSDTWYYFKTGD